MGNWSPGRLFWLEQEDPWRIINNEFEEIKGMAEVRKVFRFNAMI